MIKSVTVTNPSGESLVLELKRPDLSGFKVVSITGLGPTDATINFSDLGSGDGSMYNSSRVGTRNIVLTLAFMENPTIEVTRQLSYKYFPTKKLIKIDVETDNRTVTTYGYVERNEPNIFSSEETTQISIVCANPYFTDINSQNVNVTPIHVCPNASMDVNINGWLMDPAYSSSGGAYAGSLGISGGYSGTNFFRGTVTTAGIPRVSAPIVDALPNTTYTLSAWVRLSITRSIQAVVKPYLNDVGTEYILNGIPAELRGSPVTANAGVWTRVAITFTTSSAMNGFRLVTFLAGGSFTSMPIGTTWDVDATQYELGSTLNTYDPWYGEDASANRNLITNSSFETNTTGWSFEDGSGTATFARVVGDAVSGTAFARLLYSIVPVSNGFGNYGSVSTGVIGCFESKTYTMSLYVKYSFDASITLQYKLYSNGTPTTGNIDTTTVVCVAGVWTRISTTLTIPSGANGISWTLDNNGGMYLAGPYYIDFDAALFEKRSTLGVYYEGLNVSVNYLGETETGAIFKIRSLIPATNVVIKNVITGEFLKIDTTQWLRILSGVPDYLYDTDEVIISTLTGNKYVNLNRIGSPLKSVIGSVSRESTWLKLNPGENIFEIKADTGLDGLRFSIESPIVYEGV